MAMKTATPTVLTRGAWRDKLGLCITKHEQAMTNLGNDVTYK